jgi:hypothetical protein
MAIKVQLVVKLVIEQVVTIAAQCQATAAPSLLSLSVHLVWCHAVCVLWALAHVACNNRTATTRVTQLAFTFTILS